jgi:hypothetical protein
MKKDKKDKDLLLHWGWWPGILENMMFGCWVVNTQVGFTLWVQHLVAAAMLLAMALATASASLIYSDSWILPIDHPLTVDHWPSVERWPLTVDRWLFWKQPTCPPAHLPIFWK